MRTKNIKRNSIKTRKKSNNLKGGNKEARYSIDGYMVYDEVKGLFFTQRFGTMVYEEIVKKTKLLNKGLQLYDGFFNPDNSIKLYSPRLNETEHTFQYLNTNRDTYNSKLLNDLSYIFFSMSGGLPIIVKNPITGKTDTIILKESELYFKIKIMEGKKYQNRIDSDGIPVKDKVTEKHKFITILLCSKKKLTINIKKVDLELLLCSFGVIVKGKSADLSLPDKFNNSVTSVDKFKLNISEKYKILELLYLLTKAPYNFNGDAREDGFQQFVTDDNQFPDFIKDILKDYTGKSLLETLREYEKKTVLKKNTYKFASFLKDEYNGFLPNFSVTNPVTTEQFIADNMVDIRENSLKGAVLSNINNMNLKKLTSSKSVSKTRSKTRSKSKSKSKDKSKSKSISSDSDESPGFRRSLSKEVNNDSLLKLYDTLKQELNKTYLELDKRLYTSFEGLQKSVKGSLSKRKKKKKKRK